MTNEAIKRLDNASQFFIMTPMVKALHDVIKQWTWCGLTGGVIAGGARLGKTEAVMSLKDSIASRKGEKIPVFLITISDRDVKTIRSVHRQFARSLGQHYKKYDSSDVISEPVLMCLSDAAILNETRQVVVIVDEAQYLTVKQLSAFAEIHNDLTKAFINASFIFIANEDKFSALAKALLDKENEYLVERFFSHVYLFYGLRNVHEVECCLSEYDSFVVCETNSCSATQYYCPQLYESGWRLAQLATPIWQQYYEDYMLPLNHSSWKMSQFIRMINILLMDYLPRYENELDQDTINALITRSLEAANIKPSIKQFVASC